MNKAELEAYIAAARPGLEVAGNKEEIQKIALRIEKEDSLGEILTPDDLSECSDKVLDTLCELNAQAKSMSEANNQLSEDLEKLNGQLSDMEKSQSSSGNTGGATVKSGGKSYRIVHGIIAAVNEGEKAQKLSPKEIAANSKLVARLIESGSSCIVEL